MKVFISYSHDDIEIKENIKKILNELKIEGYIDEIWDDEQIRAGDKFNKKIFDNLIDSDIAIFIITHNTWKSWYIPNVEIPIANKFNEKFNIPKVVPLVIDKSCFNEQYFPNISPYAPIPEKNKNFKSFNKFESKDEALETIKYNIKEVIEKENFPEHKIKTDYFSFNSIEKKIKKTTIEGVQREKLNELKRWLINNNSKLAIIEGEEGTGKSILAHQFGSFAWDIGNIVIFLYSGIWTNIKTIEDLFKYSLNVDFNQNFLEGIKENIIFILDGVNEKDCINTSQSLIKDFEREVSEFAQRGIDLKLKILFTSRKLNNYTSFVKQIWENVQKIELKEYSENEFRKAVELFFVNLSPDNFPNNIRSLAKIPRYFELTLKLKDRLLGIENLDKSILFWENLKWQIENDDKFRETINLTNINDLEEKLSKFIDNQINTQIIEKDIFEKIFKERFENIKVALKEYRIVEQESPNKIKINETLLEISYIVYLMAKLKDHLFEKDFEFKELNEEIKKLLEPYEFDFISEIPYKTYLFYSQEEFENKDEILETLLYNWMENQNSVVTYKKLYIAALNYFNSFIKLLDWIERNRITTFVNIDEVMIKVLKYMWKDTKGKFNELKNYLFDENEKEIKILKRKIAISSGYKTINFLETFNKILKSDDKSHQIFFNTSTLLRIVYDGNFYKEIKEKNLKEISYVYNDKDVLDNILLASHKWGEKSLLGRLGDIERREDFWSFEGISFLPCICETVPDSFKKQVEKFFKNKFEDLSNNDFFEIIIFLSYFSSQSLLSILKEKINMIIEKDSLDFKFVNLEYLNFIFLNDNELANKILEKISEKNSALWNNFFIEFNILQDLTQNKKLIKLLIEKNFLVKSSIVFNELIDKYKNFDVTYIENKYKWFWIKKFFVPYYKDTLLFFLALFKSKKYKQKIKKFLIRKIIEEKDNSNSNIFIYLWLLGENFKFEEFIFEIFDIDKKIKNSKNYKNVTFSTTSKDIALVEFLTNVYHKWFYKKLKENRDIFKNYDYEKLKKWLGIKAVGYVLLNRKEDLYLFLEDLKKLAEKSIPSVMFLNLHEILEKIFEFFPDKMKKFIISSIEKIKNMRKKYGDNFFIYKNFELDLLVIYYKIDRVKAIEYYYEIFNYHPICNRFSKEIFKNENNELLNFVTLVKNDFEIMWLTIMFLKYKKQDILFEKIDKYLNSKSSFERQFGISFLRWFGDDNTLEILDNIKKNDKSAYVRYFAEISYYICLKEKKFKELFEDAIFEDDLTKFTLKLLSLRNCLSPVSWITVENYLQKYKDNIDNFEINKKIFYYKFLDDLDKILNATKFQIFGEDLNNQIAGIKIDKYLKVVLDL